MVVATMPTTRSSQLPKKNHPRPPLLPSSYDKGNSPGRTTTTSPPATVKRPQSAAFTRNAAASSPPASAAARALFTTARSFSVSFQGESFFLSTPKPKPSPPKPTPERRKPCPSPPSVAKKAAARTQKQSLLTRSLDFSSEMKEPVLAAVRLLRQSVLFDTSTRTASFDVGSISPSSDSDSLSSGSNSGSITSTHNRRVTPRGVIVPARYLQDPRLPSSPPGSKELLISEGKVLSPTSISSPLRGPARPSPPSKVVASQLRRNGVPVSCLPISPSGNAPSILGFTAELRRAKKGESRIEEAHLLRMLHNQYLQWRFINARACSTLVAQEAAAEKDLSRAWISTSQMHDSVTSKRIKLQLLTQKSKLISILEGQMTYLEEWSFLDREHLTSLSGAIEALKGSTLRLPVVGGTKADIRDVKDAVFSAVDTMESIGTSICSLLEKVEGANSLVTELAKVAAQEQALLEQSRNLLSVVAAMNVSECSLQGHLLQLNRKLSMMQT